MTSTKSTLFRSVRLMERHGLHYLSVVVSSSSKTARIQIVELTGRGARVKAITRTVKTNRTVLVKIPFSSKVRIVYARFV